ncbi:MAG TPA: PIN domain-containing protein [Candidatus Acidoferrales bacterium]|nr:PIN domain-containing protein [Candidatus Acidoferrales bacterium]
MTSETALLDTNVLIYAANDSSPFHKAAVALRDKGLRGELSLCITPQVLHEFYANVTNPKQIESPFTQAEARLEMEKYFHSGRILKIHPQLDTELTVLDFLKRYNVVRQEIYDLQIVATMLSNGIRRIYTYNADDFSKYPDIEVLTPDAVLG